MRSPIGLAFVTMATPIDRRTFLTALGLGGAAVIVSCAEDDATSPATTAADAPTTAASDTVAIPTAGLTDDPFAWGVTSGDPTDRSVILWTRLAAASAAAIPLKWEVATDEGFTTVVGQGIVDADPAWGHSIHLDATDLAPATEYFYRFSVDEFVSPVGRTKTTPSHDDTLDSLTIAFASCQNYAHGYYTAHDAIAADRPDAVFFLGDFIYESKGNPDSFRPFDAPETMTLEQYRDRYALYLSDPSLQASRAAAPWIVTWDDHEVENNMAGAVSENAGEDPAEFLVRRAAAYQAYYEHQPVRLEAPDGADWAIHRTVRYGNLAEFFVLDGRQYRDDQPCDDTILSPRTDCADFAEDRTMLGAEQEAWLASGLAEAQTTWKVLAQQTVMAGLVIGDLVLNVDQWDGYPAARDRLLGAIAEGGIDNVVVLTGDIHSAGAATLYTGPAAARVPAAVEFVGTSITSNSLVDRFPGGADAVAAVEFEGVKYLNVKDHGYCRCTITPQRWTTEFVVIDTKVERAVPRVDATATVQAGAAEVTVALA